MRTPYVSNHAAKRSAERLGLNWNVPEDRKTFLLLVQETSIKEGTQEKGSCPGTVKRVHEQCGLVVIATANNGVMKTCWLKSDEDKKKFERLCYRGLSCTTLECGYLHV